MNNSLANGTIGSKYMNFAFSTYFVLEREMEKNYYFIDIQGALNTEDPDLSKFSLEIRKVGADGSESTLLGFYETDGKLYIDLRGVASSQGIHVLDTSAFDLEWFAVTLQTIFASLDLGEFMGEFRIDELLGNMLTGTLGSIVGSILGTTVATTIMKFSGDGSVITTYSDGTKKLYIPLSTINGLLPMIVGIVPGLLGDTITDIYEITEMLFGWDLASVLAAIKSKEIGVTLALNAVITDDTFQGMDVNIDIEADNPLSILSWC
jgi:virulence-associated protein VapD